MARQGTYWELHEIQQRQRRRREAVVDRPEDAVRALRDALERARVLTEAAVDISTVGDRGGNGHGNGNGGRP
jgi:hypothetical protein